MDTMDEQEQTIRSMSKHPNHAIRVHHLSASSTAPPRLQPRGFFLAVAAVAVFSAVSFATQSAQPASGAQHIVIIKQMDFDPAQVTVNTGDTVEWKNEDIYAHTVTADDGSFDSGIIDPGKSWQMTVKAGDTIAYHCRPHPNMTAKLILQAAGEQATHAKAAAGGGEASATSLKWSPPMSPEQFHPILVNFTAALLPLAFLSDLLGRILRRQSLHSAAWWMVLYAAAITPFTVAAGWWWKHAAGSALPANLITVHQWLGTLAAVLFIVLALWRWSIHKRAVPPSFAYLTFALIAVLALVYQGSLGGKMLFGK
jgi:plastocyanin/uncharacterized membrane protein